MSGRTIHVPLTFLPDGLAPARDGAQTPFYAVQAVMQTNNHPKCTVVYAEHTAGVLTEVLRVPQVIGAPHICTRPDGTAYVTGGGKDSTIETGYDVPGWVAVSTDADVRRLQAAVSALLARVVLLEAR